MRSLRTRHAKIAKLTYMSYTELRTLVTWIGGICRGAMSEVCVSQIAFSHLLFEYTQGNKEDSARDSEFAMSVVSPMVAYRNANSDHLALDICVRHNINCI